MTQDPIVKEVRDIRHQIDKEYGQDPEEYYQHLQRLQKNLLNVLFVGNLTHWPFQNKRQANRVKGRF